jgi:hypothetical protein
MGDAGEGLVDSEARIQERRDEIERERAERHRVRSANPELERVAESLRLARAELDRQLSATTHERRRAQITQAIAEVDRRLDEIQHRHDT